MNEWGRADSITVSLTRNRVDPASVIWNRFPVVVPLAPMFKLNKSPEPVVELPGAQSKVIKEPEVSAVEVEVRLIPVPEVSESTERSNPVPVFIESAKSEYPIPDVATVV